MYSLYISVQYYSSSNAWLLWSSLSMAVQIDFIQQVTHYHSQAPRDENFVHSILNHFPPQIQNSCHIRKETRGSRSIVWIVRSIRLFCDAAGQTPFSITRLSVRNHTYRSWVYLSVVFDIVLKTWIFSRLLQRKGFRGRARWSRHKFMSAIRFTSKYRFG